ncbi:MAG: phosphoenolpyruvate--protein phosphotransferase [Bacteroidota bacterium]
MTTEVNTKNREIILRGIAASPGIAMGPIYVYDRDVPEVIERSTSAAEAEREIDRLRKAVERSQKELRKVLAFTQQKIGEAKAKIFEAQMLILEDTHLFSSIHERIRRELKNAEFIVDDEIGKYQKMMLASDDEYMLERAHDVEDLKNRIIRNIQEERLYSKLEGSAIIVSKNLTAADTVLFSRNEVLGYATDLGGITSHAALLSRALKIPAVVGLREATPQVQNATETIIDGYHGLLILNPSETTIEEYQRKRQRHREFEEKLAGLKDLPADTLDGRKIQLSANIEFEEEIEFVILQGSAGVGLYRTENLLLGKDAFPTEEEQFEKYQAIAEKIFPQRVILRTFDIGGDKLLPQAYQESNPFLGWRGIRISLDQPEMFLQQLRALLKASARKNVGIMLPMVTSVKEIRETRRYLEQAKTELRKRNVPFDERAPIGAMVETPSAAVLAQELAAEVDFLSIGTNDLIQYLLAVDRANTFVSNLYQEFHPAVLKAIQFVIEHGHQRNVWVGMCGEMAGHPLATVLLVGLGLDEFSVIPSVLPEIKKIIRSIRYKEARKIAKKAMTMHSEEDVKEYLTSIVKEKFPDIDLGS